MPPSKRLSARVILANWKVGAIWLAIVLATLAVGGFLVAWSGLYSVAASRGHWPGFSMFLEFAMRSSVRTQSFGIDVPELGDAALVERGAGHFQGGCQPCHGAPGRPSSPIVHAMLPTPPDLRASVTTFKPRELFWIVKHGLKYTGMPAWVARDRDDEVWAMVAFLQQLPQTDAREYRQLAGLDLRDIVPPRTLAQGGPVGASLAACSRCHGLDGKGRPSGAFPRLDIQTPDYLVRQLQAYAAGTRPSGMMQPVAAELEADDLQQLANYYAAQRPAETPIPSASGDRAQQLGRTLATTGMPDTGIPPCLSCHAEDPASRGPFYPALNGQYASFTAQQLMLFKAGQRRGTPAADIMSVIAGRLTPDQIESVSLYFAGLPGRTAGGAQ